MTERKMKYNPTHHHRRSICLKGYDYSQIYGLTEEERKVIQKLEK